MHRVLSIVAVQQCWATAELCGVQHFIGVHAVTNKAVFQYDVQSSTGAGSMHRVLSIVVLQQYWVTVELYEVQHLIGVHAVTNKAVFDMGCRAAPVQAACTGS